MSQTSYPTSMPKAYNGMLSDLGPSQKDSKRNDESVEVPFGLLVVTGGDQDSFKLPAAAGDRAKILGVTMHTHARPTINGADVDIGADERGSVLSRGRIYVPVEETVAVGDKVFARFATKGGNTQLGKWRNDADGVAEVQTLTPTAVNSTDYNLRVSVGDADFDFHVLSDGSATATEICDSFRTLMAADAAFTALITASGTATLILTSAAGQAFTSQSTGPGAIAVVVTTPAAATCFEVKGARWVSGGSTTSPAELEIDAMMARLS